MNTVRWNRRPAAVGLMILGLAWEASAGAIGPAGAATVGQLAVQAAQAAGLALPDAGGPKAALEGLAKIGIRLGTDASAAVTEDTLARLGEAVGVRVTSSRPGSPVSPAMSRTFVQSIRGALLQASVAARGGQEAIRASCQGRESRQGRKGTPASNADPNATSGPCEEPLP